jgi:hypothetical protein
VRIRDNVFQGGVGIALGLGKHLTCGELTISNNTFFQCGPWLDLRKTPPATKNVTIVNNLILQPSTNIRSEQDSLTDFGKQWAFHSNYCEQSDTGEPGAQQLMTFQPEIQVLSRDPMDAELFLRLPAESPLARGAGTKNFPAHVGAYPPQEQ